MCLLPKNEKISKSEENQQDGILWVVSDGTYVILSTTFPFKDPDWEGSWLSVGEIAEFKVNKFEEIFGWKPIAHKPEKVRLVCESA